MEHVVGGVQVIVAQPVAAVVEELVTAADVDDCVLEEHIGWPFVGE